MVPHDGQKQVVGLERHGFCANYLIHNPLAIKTHRAQLNSAQGVSQSDVTRAVLAEEMGLKCS